MKLISFALLLFIFLIGPIIQMANGSQQRILPDLRRSRIRGVAGRFVVNRDALEQEIQSRKEQDAVCGQDVNIQLTNSMPHAAYNASYQDEVLLTSFAFTDETLKAELSNDQKEQVATSLQIFTVFLPFVTGLAEEHGILILRHFTNNAKKLTFFFGTSPSDVTQVDSFEEGDNGMVTIRLGDDVMIYQVNDDVKCNMETNVGKDFDNVTGQVVKITNYPLPFDWGCEVFGAQVSFCEVLDKYRCEIRRVGGDICSVTSDLGSKRIPTTMAIVKMTGKFRELIPFLADTVPNEGFEAEFIERHHSTGIVYPCLS